MARQALDGKTLTVGLVYSLGWCASYPFFIGAWQLVSVFAQRPPSVLLWMATIPVTVIVFMYACTCLFFSPTVAWIGALVIRKIGGDRLAHRSWLAVLTLGMTFSVLSVTLLAIRLHFLPPDFADVSPTAPPYLKLQHSIHAYLWPAGAVAISIVLSFVSAILAFLVFRPTITGTRAP